MSEVNSVVADSLASIAAVNENIKRLNEEAKVARQKALEPFLAALAASGEVSIIVVRGYTPGFNDGEPCEHSADYFVNVKSVWSEDLHEYDVGVSLPEDLVEGLEHEESWVSGKGRVTDEKILAKNVELCKEHGHVYLEPSKDIMEAISTLIFDTEEEQNGTDYYAAYILKDGKFEVSHGEYDCGY